MNIFDAVRELLAKDYLRPEDRDRLEQAMEETPTVVANITGGVLQGASANMPAVLIALDFEDTSPSPNVVEIEGSPAYAMEEGALVDPAFVNHVVEALAG